MKRKAIGKRAVDLAQELDSTPETISRWENGKAEIESRLSCCWLLWSKIKSEAQHNEQLIRALHDKPEKPARSA